MDLEELFVALLEKIEQAKEQAKTPELKRIYAILNTDAEKLHAFYLVYAAYMSEGD